MRRFIFAKKGSRPSFCQAFSCSCCVLSTALRRNLLHATENDLLVRAETQQRLFEVGAAVMEARPPYELLVAARRHKASIDRGYETLTTCLEGSGGVDDSSCFASQPCDLERCSLQLSRTPPRANNTHAQTKDTHRDTVSARPPPQHEPINLTTNPEAVFTPTPAKPGRSCVPTMKSLNGAGTPVHTSLVHPAHALTQQNAPDPASRERVDIYPPRCLQQPETSTAHASTSTAANSPTSRTAPFVACDRHPTDPSLPNPRPGADGRAAKPPKYHYLGVALASLVPPPANRATKHKENAPEPTPLYTRKQTRCAACLQQPPVGDRGGL